MKTVARTLLPLVFGLLILSAMAQDEGDWKLVKSQDGLDVFIRKPHTSSIHQLRLQTTFDTDMETLLSYLAKVEHFTDWVYKCKYARRINLTPDGAGVYYSRMDFPWPLRDRDYYAESTLTYSESGEKVRIDVKGVPDYGPEDDGYVRIPFLQIEWNLHQIAPGKVEVKYELHSHPGGKIPAWLVNMAVDKGPTETIRNLKAQLKKEIDMPKKKALPPSRGQ